METHDSILNRIQDEYFDALFKGEVGTAGAVMLESVRRGLNPFKLYSEVIVPAQSKIDELWQQGRLSLAEEHLAAQITLSEMGRLRHLVRPKFKLNMRCVIASIDGDPHYLGGRMIADFFNMEGWEVQFLGTHTPPTELVQYIATRDINLVCLSIALEKDLPEAKSTIAKLLQLKDRPKIIVGGALAADKKDELLSAGADGVARNANEAIEQARRLLGLVEKGEVLQQFLKGLGSRIQEWRKSRQLSQQELANTSGLDRAYISSLENGRQNLTIGAVLKLAEALGVSIEDILVGSVMYYGDRGPDFSHN